VLVLPFQLPVISKDTTPSTNWTAFRARLDPTVPDNEILWSSSVEKGILHLWHATPWVKISHL
jgi:hypothetical protein